MPRKQRTNRPPAYAVLLAFAIAALVGVGLFGDRGERPNRPLATASGSPSDRAGGSRGGPAIDGDVTEPPTAPHHRATSVQPRRTTAGHDTAPAHEPATPVAPATPPGATSGGAQPDDAGESDDAPRAGSPTRREDAEAAAQAAFVAEIRDGFRAARGALRDCYELVLDLDDERADVLVFELMVRTSSTDSTVGDATLQGIEAGSFTLEELECFADVVTTMTFPPPRDGQEYTMRYPVTLANE